MRRLKNLSSAVLAYYRSWRGVAVALALGLAFVISALGRSINVADIALFVIGFTSLLVLIAHESRRTASRLEEALASITIGHAFQEGTPAHPIHVQTSNRKPDVTVVVPAFNESRYLSTCLDSLRWQDHTAWEAVVVDDGSTDDTQDVALSYMDLDPRVRVIRLENNVGLASARNLGVDATRTEFVTFLDADDFLYPQSLSSRLAAVRPLKEEPWCAGVYCNWASVSEDDRGLTSIPEIRDRGTVTWLNSFSDAPFIASAAVLRTQVVRKVGGFPAVATAEDAALWNVILRHGWSFASVAYTGVAYRMRQTSLFRSAPVLHTDIIESIARSNSEVFQPTSDASPYPFTQSYSEYLPGVTRVKRLIGALASLIESGVDSTMLVEELATAFETHHAWTIDLEEAVDRAARRVTAYLGANGEVALQRVSASLGEVIHDLRQRSRDEVMLQMSRSDTRALPSNYSWRESRPVTNPTIPPSLLASPNSPTYGRLIILPTARYHVDEAGPLADVLEERGIPSVVMAREPRWSWIRNPLSTFEIPMAEAVDSGPWLKESLGVLTFNDWGEYGHEYVVAANELGIPTFAKVEGVQDFADADVHWDRKAYQWATTILAQGENDLAALPGRSATIVGSTRLERIWHAKPRVPNQELAVINLNFTYGVLDEARDLWLLTAVEGCKQAQMPFVISLHPAERDRYGGRYPVASDPMRHLLTSASVLISRFSTVPFEAMARGVPFIYHNPHGERVPTFQDPDGAFEISDDVRSLRDAVRDSRAWVNNYRERASKFFLRQVDIDVSRTAQVRGAEAVLSRLSSLETGH